METGLIVVVVILFLFCVIFPLQMRRYLKKLRVNSQRHLNRNNNQARPRRNVSRQNDNNVSSDNHLVLLISHTTPLHTESHARDEAATRHLEAEHRRKIIEIQREIEQQARNRNATPKIINSSTVRDPEATHSQQIIDLQREIERQAIQRREERRADPFTPHMPPRLDSAIHPSIYTITPERVLDVSNTSVNFPCAPPLTPSDVGDEMKIHYPHRIDDQLPSYEQALALNSTTSSAVNRY